MREPTMTGPHARAWKMEKPEAMERMDWAATVSSWVINAPSAHPMWSWWQLSVVHLRDIEGVPKAHKQYPEAQFEFLIMAFNPEKGVPDIDLMDAGKEWGKPAGTFLSPVDVVHQFHGVTDDQAAEIARVSAWAVTTGLLSPDQDYRSRWEFHLKETVGHWASGKHDGAKAL